MILSGPRASEAEFARFAAEAQAVAKLRHPNIVQIYDVGGHEGRPYLALEYVEGGNLETHLAHTPQPPRPAAQLVETLARAVHYAHTQGVVHRDLKPANVLLSPAFAGSDLLAEDRGRACSSEAVALGLLVPKITDFGLAKRLEDDSGLTRSGEIVGTPAYMAPEQTERGPNQVGPAVDIHALGAILYEVLTGRTAYHAPSLIETLEQVRGQEPVSPRRLQPRVPRDLETICLKCLEKDPRKRYATAEALADDLRRFLRGEPILARPVTAGERTLKWVRRRPATAALVGALAAVVVLFIASALSLWRLAAGRLDLAEVRRGEAEAHLAEARHQQARAEANAQLAADRLEEVRRQHARAEANALRAQATVDEYLSRVSDQLDDAPGTHALRRSLLESALKYYRTFLRERADDPTLRLEVAKAHTRVAHITREMGDPASALPWYQKALTLYQELLRDQPTTPLLLDNLIGCWHGLARVQTDMGQFPDAIVSYEKGLAVCERLPRGTPAQANEYASTSGNLRLSLGEVYYKMGKNTEAEAAYQAAHAELTKLTQAVPGHGAYLDLLGRCENALGMLYRQRNQNGPARAHYEKAVDIFTDLVRTNPDDRLYRTNLAKTSHNLGNLYRTLRLNPAAGVAYERARTLYVGLVDDFPRVPYYRNGLGQILTSLGRLKDDAGDTVGALDAFRQASEVLERVHRDNPNETQTQHDLGACYNALCSMLRQHKRVPEALDAGYKARAVLEPLVQRLPDAPAHRSLLGGALHNLAMAVEAQGRHDEAVDLYQSAVRHQRQALDAGPESANARRFLRNHYMNLANLHRRLGRVPESAAALRDCRQLQRDHAGDLFAAAEGYALLVPQVGRGKANLTAEEQAQRQQLADEAVDTLRQAVRNGFRNAGALADSPSLAPLRDRADFQELVEELKKSAGPR
jgi:tetratricopeptide (TPR) repeat protein